MDFGGLLTTFSGLFQHVVTIEEGISEEGVCVLFVFRSKSRGN